LRASEASESWANIRIVSSDDQAEGDGDRHAEHHEGDQHREQRRRRHSRNLADRHHAAFAQLECSRLVGEQPRRLAAPEAHESLAEAQREQGEAERHDRARHPLLDRQVLHFDADLVHLLHIAPAAEQDDQGVGDAKRGADQGDHARAARAELTNRRIDADVGADANAVRHADEDQPGEQLPVELERPDEL
jgi:hypothetical protein